MTDLMVSCLPGFLRESFSFGSLVLRQLLVLACWLQPALAWADGGMVRFCDRAGPYQLSVFTAPTPLRAGPVDVSVLVQDAAALRPLADARVTIEITAPPLPSRRYELTRDAATNKLMTAAQFDWPGAGQWRVHVAVSGELGQAQAQFALEIHEPLPPWREMAAWIAWPFGVIALFTVHQMLMHRRCRKVHQGID